MLGVVTIDFEMGSVAGFSEFGLYSAITNSNGQLDPIPGFDFLTPTNGTLRAVWNTTLVTNETYRLVFGANLGSGNIAGIEGRAFTANVANPIWFPDAFNWAGYFIEVQAQSIHANASAHVDVYDESGTQFVSLDTTTDSQGFVMYEGVRGFRLNNYDQNGEQYPDNVYTIVVSTLPSGGSGGSVASAAATGTNFIWVEAPWPNTAGNLNTQFAIAYMPVFYASSQSALILQGLIQNVYSAAEGRNGFNVIRGQSEDPFELNSITGWVALNSDLRVNEVRNFYYFGHGNPNYIGQANLQTNPPLLNFLDVAVLNAALNNKPVSTTRPRHPIATFSLTGATVPMGAFAKRLEFQIRRTCRVLPSLRKGFVIEHSWGGTILRSSRWWDRSLSRTSTS